MIVNRRIASNLIKAAQMRSGFSEVVKTQSKAPKKRQYLQFSKSRLVDFGELPFGEIPEALKSSRPTTVQKLSNGTRVATEYWPGNQAAITVNVKAGSRQQTLDNSSVAQFAAHGSIEGTQNLSKEQIEEQVDRFGGVLEIQVDRQITRYTLYLQPKQIEDALKFLSEIVLRPQYDSVQVEALKSTIYNRAANMDPFKNTLQNLHYTSFRDHYFGQPSTGVRENVYNITSEQIREFHGQHYTGDNIVISVAGEVDSDRVNTLASEHFGSAQESSASSGAPNREKPAFTPSLMFQRDDELPNTSAGACFLAPSWNDADFFAMHYFTRLIGEFQIDKYTGAHLNSSHLQYNSFHGILGSYPDIVLQKPFYLAYSDVGLFGNFIFGNEIFNREMILMTQNQMSTYAQNINVVEVFRARNKYWNDLLERNDPADVSSRNARQVAYLDRLIPRTEIATRVSHMDNFYLQKVASKWFWDKHTSVVAWGNLHSVATHGHYNRQYQRATLGEYSMMDVYHKL